MTKDAVDEDCPRSGPNRASAQVPKIAYSPSVLDRLDRDLTRSGVVGEPRAKRLGYMALTTRYFDQPVGIVFKGATGSGKTFVLKHILKTVPKRVAYMEFSSSSSKAIHYAKGDFEHKFIVFHEAAGITNEDTKTALKLLATDHRLIHRTVENIKGRFTPRVVMKRGPSGLILTTTRNFLDPELESRLISVPITDAPEQTEAILLSMTEHDDSIRRPMPYRSWRVFHEWLGQQDNRVEIPFDTCLARLMHTPPRAWRRMFDWTLSLIRAHAVLQQMLRERGRDGRIQATLDDYEPVRDLLADLVAEQAGADVTKEVRETVNAVAQITLDETHATATAVAKHLDMPLDLSSVYKRIEKAIALGYLHDQRDYRSTGMRIVLDRPLPEPAQILPTRQQLHACMQAQRRRRSTNRG